MSNKQLSLWEDQRLRLADSLELSIASLNAYGENYRHWAIAYSGGKDSSALVSFRNSAFTVVDLGIPFVVKSAYTVV